MTWLIICAGAIAFEIATRTFFTIWFAFGAALAYLASLFGLPFWAQMLIFLAVSILILKLFRHYAVQTYIHNTNLDALVDKEVTVCRENTNGPLVKVDGVEWAIINQSTEGVVVGDRVVIKGVQGVKLFTEKI